MALAKAKAPSATMIPSPSCRPVPSAAIAVAIKLDSRGPIFFRQLRVGQHGERFYMLKFRTMVPDAEAMKDSLRDRNEAQDGLFKIADDPRVTRVERNAEPPAPNKTTP